MAAEELEDEATEHVHVSLLHTLGQGSTRHTGQGMPLSHCSPDVFTPSPQTALQTLGEPMQIYPVSAAQNMEQPSPLTTFLSSHCSLASRMPLPQRSGPSLGSLGEPHCGSAGMVFQRPATGSHPALGDP